MKIDDINLYVVGKHGYSIPMLKHCYVRLNEDNKSFCELMGKFVKLQTNDEEYAFKIVKILAKKFIKKIENIFDFKFDDFTLENYNPHAPIKAPIAV